MAANLIVAMTVVATCGCRVDFGQPSLFERRNRFTRCWVLTAEDLKSRSAQLTERSRADTASHDRVDILAVQGRDRLAHSMSVVEVLVLDRPALAALGIHHNEGRRRPEVPAHLALQTLVL
jgi:hypothetical protein